MNDYSDGPVWRWFGLSYGNYFAVPRRTLQSMPVEWQQRFVDLMDEASALLPSEAFPPTIVTGKNSNRFCRAPLSDYRHTGPIQPKDKK